MDRQFMNEWGAIIALCIVLTAIFTIIFADYFGVCKIQRNTQQKNSCNCTPSVCNQQVQQTQQIQQIQQNSTDSDVSSNSTTSTSDQNQTKNKITLYYADWCGHCKQFKPEWTIVKNNYTGNDLTFIEVNCGTNPETCSSAGINGFPAVYLEKSGGEKYQYTSYPRTAKSLVDFIHGVM